jgi:hypothetical protein
MITIEARTLHTYKQHHFICGHRVRSYVRHRLIACIAVVFIVLHHNSSLFAASPPPPPELRRAATAAATRAAHTWRGHRHTRTRTRHPHTYMHMHVQTASTYFFNASQRHCRASPRATYNPL